MPTKKTDTKEPVAPMPPPEDAAKTPDEAAADAKQESKTPAEKVRTVNANARQMTGGQGGGVIPRRFRKEPVTERTTPEELAKSTHPKAPEVPLGDPSKAEAAE